jgi:hypothetical protein
VIFGLLGVVLLLVLGGVDVTAAQIARARLLDTSDSAALEAANALDEASAYSGGRRPRTAAASATQLSSATEQSNGPLRTTS